jgi:hypothetical protein
MNPKVRQWIAPAALVPVIALVIHMWPASSQQTAAAPAAESIAVSEKRLARLRDLAATAPIEEKNLATVTAELAAREKGLIIADTAPQAQALLIGIVRELGQAETPAVLIRNTEGLSIRPFGDAYGEASVSMQIECRIDQLVNILAGLAARKELVATTDLRIVATNTKEKTVNVHLTVAGVVPRKLVPEKRS